MQSRQYILEDYITAKWPTLTEVCALLVLLVTNIFKDDVTLHLREEPQLCY